MKIETLIALLQVMALPHPGCEVKIHQYTDEEEYSVDGINTNEDVNGDISVVIR